MTRLGQIPSHWVALHPAHRMDATYWLMVLDLLKRDGIDPNAATDEQVSKAIAEVGDE